MYDLSSKEILSGVNLDNINRSYFIGFNDEMGWQVRHYFTFYGEFQRQNAVLAYVEAVVVSLIFLIIVTGNILVLVILCATRDRRVPNNYFIGNLAVASLFCASTSPLIAVTRITNTWIFGRIACSFMVYAEYCGAIITVWTMAFISIDRHRGTKKRSPLRTKSVVVMIIILWIVALCAGVPLAMFFVMREFPFGTGVVQICTLVWPYNENYEASVVFTLPSLLVMFVLPLSVILVNYVRIMGTLRASMKKFKSGQLSTSESSKHTSTMAGRLYKSHKEMRIVYFLILLVVMFCIFWIPISVSFALILYDGLSNALIMTSTAFVASVCLAMLNACVSPIIYAFVNERYRNGLIKLLKISRHRRKRITNVVHPVSMFRTDTQGALYANDGDVKQINRTDSMIPQVSF